MPNKSLSRGRGPRIREEELDKMIALYLEGKSYKAISKEVGRHWQTVRKYVIKALQEREGRELRRDALKGALTDHYHDLVLALGSLDELLKVPEVDRQIIPGGWQPLTPDRRTRLILQALRESHAKESPIWSWWDSWNLTANSYYQKLITLHQRVVQETSKLEKSDSGASRTITEYFTEKLFQRATSLISNSPLYDPSMLEVRPGQNNDSPEELWLARSTLFATGEHMTKMKEEVSKLMKDMVEWKEVNELAQLYRQMIETKDKIDEEAEVISLRRAFPGHCRLCPV